MKYLLLYLFFIIAISFIGGKFVVGENARVKEKEPWEKYMIPNVKSKRLTYHNLVTKEIYLSAYSSKQSRFHAYLIGQRQFRWSVKCNLEKLEQLVSSYKNGQIPKENINCLRYRKFPEDVKIDDVSKSQQALDHIKNTIKTINEEKSKLLNRKMELYADYLEPKNWAANEINFVQEMTTHVESMLTESNNIAHDIEHVSNQLAKRFDVASVNENERKRKAKRVKEQKSKTKKKRSIAEKSKVGCPSTMSDMSSDDDIPIDILDDKL